VADGVGRLSSRMAAMVCDGLAYLSREMRQTSTYTCTMHVSDITPVHGICL
jgi:hypothetical protein